MKKEMKILDADVLVTKISYIPKWKRVILKWINISPQVRYSYSVCFQNFDNRLCVGDLVVTDTGYQFVIIHNGNPPYIFQMKSAGVYIQDNPKIGGELVVFASSFLESTESNCQTE